MRILAAIFASSVSIASATSWDYATLVESSGYYEWSTSGKTALVSDDFTQLVSKMGCRPLGGKTANFIDLLTCAGKQGWELVAIRSFANRTDDQWIFKRPK